VTSVSGGRGEVERLAYTPRELAAAFGLSRKAIYRAIASGELAAARVCCGSRLLVPVEEARAWVGRHLIERDRPPEVRLDFAPPRRLQRSPLRDAFREDRPAA
jgi:excisionase family DNA binding protein